MALVCDGIGGLTEGETASGYTAERLTAWFSEEAAMLASKRGALRRVRKSLLRECFRIDRELERYGKQKQISLGTTLTLLFAVDKKYLLLSLGDSRACLLKRTRIKWLTRDDTGKDGSLTGCIGSFGWHPPEVRRGRLGRYTALLLCTDGFWRRLKPEELETLRLQKGEALQAKLEEAGARLQKRGERDNITAVCIRWGGGRSSIRNERKERFGPVKAVGKELRRCVRKGKDSDRKV